MSAAASLERAGNVAILRMTAAENRFNATTEGPSFLLPSDALRLGSETWLARSA
jgi:hypothetical protein